MRSSASRNKLGSGEAEELVNIPEVNDDSTHILSTAGPQSDLSRQCKTPCTAFIRVRVSLSEQDRNQRPPSPADVN